MDERQLSNNQFDCETVSKHLGLHFIENSKVANFQKKMIATMHERQLTNRKGFSLDFIAPSGVVAKAFDTFHHVHIERDVVRFTVVQCFQLLW